MVAFRRRPLHHHFPGQYLVLYRVDTAVGMHAFCHQQIARRRAHPAGDRLQMFIATVGCQHLAHQLQAFMHFLRRFRRNHQQLADIFLHRIRMIEQNQIGFTGLGDQRQRKRMQRMQAAVDPLPT